MWNVRNTYHSHNKRLIKVFLSYYFSDITSSACETFSRFYFSHLFSSLLLLKLFTLIYLFLPILKPCFARFYSIAPIASPIFCNLSCSSVLRSSSISIVKLVSQMHKNFKFMDLIILCTIALKSLRRSHTVLSCMPSYIWLMPPLPYWIHAHFKSN